MLHVQVRIGHTILPALVDNGACDDFISEQAVGEMHLEARHLRRTTRILSANGKSMECASYVVVTAVWGALSFQLSLRVIPSSVRVILGFPFLQHFDPRISWRNGTLTISRGTDSWGVPTCLIPQTQSPVLGHVLSRGGTPTEIYQAPSSKRAVPYVSPGGIPEGFLGHTSSSATYQVHDQTPRSRPIHE